MTAIPAPLARIAAIADGGRLLRTVLRLDACASGAMGLAAVVGASVLTGPLGAPDAYLRGLGAFLVLFAGALLVLAARPSMPVPAVWTVVLGNLAWVVASVATAVLAPLTAVGTVVVVAQALAVVVFADLQWLGLRRMTA